MNFINSKDLKRKIDQQENFKLVNAMKKGKFKAAHISGSLNINNETDMLSQLKVDDEIIVYCSDQGCNDSIILYHMLESAGYNNITRFSGGLLEWFNAGFSLIENK